MAATSPFYVLRGPRLWVRRDGPLRSEGLLAGGDASLVNIAVDYGFAARPQFSTALLQTAGIAPGRRRRECRR